MSVGVTSCTITGSWERTNHSVALIATAQNTRRCNKMRNLPKGYQRNKVILTLTNSELNTLRDLFAEDETDMGKHVMQQINGVQ